MAIDDFFAGPPEREPARVGGRYRLPHPETGVEQSWTAATTHAQLPEDSFALTRWRLRQLLLGLRRRPDLLRLVESWLDEPGKDDLDAVIDSAEEIAGSGAKANLGTAVHAVLQGVDRQWPEAGADDEWAARVAAEAPEWARPHVAGYVAEMRRQGLAPVASMTERRVLNLALGCAGTIDNIYAEHDGTLVLGDKKTGRADHYTERAFAIQTAVYAHSDYLLDQAGGPPIDLRSLGLRAEYAVLVHVDPATGGCATYRVDLRRGQYGANLAAEVREWRRERHLLLPYVPPGPVPAEVWRAAEGERHLKAVPSGPMMGETRVAGDEVQQWNGQHWIYVGPATTQPTTTDGAEKQPSEVDSGSHAVSGGLVDEPAAPAPVRSEQSMDDLMKLPKAELQRVLRSLDPGASVAHQRKILAEKIITAQSGGRVATTTPNTSRHVSNANDPAEVAGPIGGDDPTDPRSPAFHRARLAEIGAAPTVAELGRIHQTVVRLGGDHAWTDELTEAARTRTAVLDSGPLADNDDPRTMLRVAASSREIAEVWERVTVGGSVPERWTPELAALADRRLAEITPPAPSANPYADGAVQ